MRTLALLTLAVLLFADAGVVAQEARKDLAASGREFAIKVCGACHVVEKDQKPLLQPPAPSFSAVVARRKFDETWLRAFLSSPHGNVGRARKMPNPRLAEFQIDKTVAYFQQLKARLKRQ